MSVRRTAAFWLLVGLLVGPEAARADDEPVVDPDVQPAQYVRPAAITQLPDAAPPAGAVAPDPPTPVVRLHIAAPSHISPHKDVPYKITVQNASAARAYSVRVRNPLPPGVAPVKADPPPTKQTAAGLEWQLGNLGPGESKVIDLTLKPKPGASDIDNKAFVSFEHGQEVDTKVDKPKLAVRKAAPKQTVGTDPIRVQVEVTNNSKIAVANVKLVEDVGTGFRYTAEGDSEQGTKPGQRVWNLGTLRAGERKVIEYRLASSGGGDLLAQSAVSGEHVEAELAESKTKVLVPGLKLELTGSPGAQPGAAAKYEATVTNTGTLPLTDIRVRAGVPVDCKAASVTNGGQIVRDGVVWSIPNKPDGPLKPGESYAVRFGLKAATSGQRTVRVTADAGHGMAEQAREVTTAFQAAALLKWTAELEQPSVPVYRLNMLTIRVKNAGGDAARNTHLTVLLPGGVMVSQASPEPYTSQAGTINFAPTTVPPGGTAVYTVTFEAKRPGPAHFSMQLRSESLGEFPLVKEQEVQITPAPGGR